jgi:hypothetical protein
VRTLERRLLLPFVFGIARTRSGCLCTSSTTEGAKAVSQLNPHGRTDDCLKRSSVYCRREEVSLSLVARFREKGRPLRRRTVKGTRGSSRARQTRSRVTFRDATRWRRGGQHESYPRNERPTTFSPVYTTNDQAIESVMTLWMASVVALGHTASGPCKKSQLTLVEASLVPLVGRARRTDRVTYHVASPS